MSDEPNNGVGAPAPEALQPQSAASQPSGEVISGGVKETTPAKRRITYRPSHKATFVGLTVVALILGINVAVVAWLMNSQQDAQAKAQESVTISADTLKTLGVSRNPVGNLGTQLVVGPKAKFNSNVELGGDVSVAGKLQLNSTFSASDAKLANLDAGDTSVDKLNINGDATATTLNLRKDLNVVGASKLQGPVTMSQLLTVNNSVNIAGNLAVGGTLSTRTFQANSLTSGSTLTIGGHLITKGSSPNVGRGDGTGSNGTVSISGTDAAGTVAVNVGTGGGNGTLAQISFRTQYGSTPHVVVTPVGRGAGNFYVTRSSGGFTIGTSSSLTAGGYAFDYIVMQ